MSRRRNGFTLIELLIVVFIIGLLAALLLPAIARSRAAARRVHCVANISNVGKAILHFETQNQRLPPSGRYLVQDDDAVRTLGSWVGDVLAELDQQSLAAKWDPTARWFDQSSSQNGEISRIALPSLVCPDDESVSPERPARSYAVNGGFGLQVPSGSSAASRSAPHVARFSPSLGFPAFVALDLNGNGLTGATDVAASGGSTRTDIDLYRQTGVFFGLYEYQGGRQPFGGSISLAEVRDGLSQTILVSENLWERQQPIVSDASWANPWGGTFTTSAYMCDLQFVGVNSMARCTPGAVHYEHANNHSGLPHSEQAINGDGIPLSAQYAAGSPWLSSGHRSGVNMVLCDGSARFLSERINGEVFAKLVTPAGSNLPSPLRQTPLDQSEF